MTDSSLEKKKKNTLQAVGISLTEVMFKHSSPVQHIDI